MMLSPSSSTPTNGCSSVLKVAKHNDADRDAAEWPNMMCTVSSMPFRHAIALFRTAARLVGLVARSMRSCSARTA